MPGGLPGRSMDHFRVNRYVVVVTDIYIYYYYYDSGHLSMDYGSGPGRRQKKRPPVPTGGQGGGTRAVRSKACGHSGCATLSAGGTGILSLRLGSGHSEYSDTNSLTNAEVCCNAPRDVLPQGGGITQSAQEYPARAVVVPVHPPSVGGRHCLSSAQLVVYLPGPTHCL